MRYALGQSLNIPAIKGLEYVTLERFNNTLQRFGVQTPGETPMAAGLPSAIGGIEIYPFEMGVAMATLANGGVRQEPFAIQRIEDRSGNIIYQAPENPPGVQVTRAEYAYLVTHILADDSVKFVAAESIPGWQAAAKTGTTNDNRDVWTVGYTTQAALAVWVGRTDNQPMASTVLGTNTAAPIWNKVLTAALSGSQVINFNVPSGVQQYQVCSVTGAIYSADNCPGGNPLNEVAFNTQPPPQSSFLVTLSVDNFSGLLANENCPEDVVQRSFVNVNDTSAIDWLNGNANGQTWAETHNIQLPITTPPTTSCTPGMPRPQLMISSPVPNGAVSGLTVINGTVRVPGFTGYEFQLASANTPTEFSSALGQIYITEQPNPNSVLGAVDFTPYADGNYILRLLAHGQGNASAKVDVPIQITHGAVAPIPGGFPTSTPAPTLTPFGF
jgi:membrane peptidoglycan carboxypeptidase